jgi:hypothetical protein
VTVETTLPSNKPTDEDQDARPDEAGDKVGSPAGAEVDVEGREYEVGDNSADDTEKNVHQQAHIAVHDLFGKPASNAANNDGRDPAYLSVLHVKSPPGLCQTFFWAKPSKIRLGRPFGHASILLAKTIPQHGKLLLEAFGNFIRGVNETIVFDGVDPDSALFQTMQMLTKKPLLDPAPLVELRPLLHRRLTLATIRELIQ